MSKKTAIVISIIIGLFIIGGSVILSIYSIRIFCISASLIICAVLLFGMIYNIYMIIYGLNN